MSSDKPFDGAISAFFENDAPDTVRNSIRRAEKGDILDPGFPHSEKMPRKAYEKEMAALQIELVKLQAWARESGARIAIVFEGRDAAGKGGVIKAMTELEIEAPLATINGEAIATVTHEVEVGAGSSAGRWRDSPSGIR